jgi:hypothetical protein
MSGKSLIRQVRSAPLPARDVIAPRTRAETG